MVKSARLSLGARLMVGQRTLTPYVEVRILCPQQKKALIQDESFFCLLFRQFKGSL